MNVETVTGIHCQFIRMLLNMFFKTFNRKYIQCVAYKEIQRKNTIKLRKKKQKEQFLVQKSIKKEKKKKKKQIRRWWCTKINYSIFPE